MTATAGVIDLSPWQLGLAVLLVGVVVVISAREALGLERDLVVGAVRTIVQLYLVGFILASVFAAGRWYWARVLSARPLSDELVGPMGANAWRAA